MPPDAGDLGADASVRRAPSPGAEVFPATAHRSALVYIPGTGPDGFLMGSPETEKGRADDETQHRVVLSAFLLTATEVTQGQFVALTGERPSYFEGSDALPVERVSWYDAVAYANALSAKEGLDPLLRPEEPEGHPLRRPGEGQELRHRRLPGRGDPILDRADRWRCTGYRLPTESEWEWAARGRKITRYWKGDAESDLKAVGWYDGNGNTKTHQLGPRPLIRVIHPLAGGAAAYADRLAAFRPRLATLVSDLAAYPDTKWPPSGHVPAPLRTFPELVLPRGLDAALGAARRADDVAGHRSARRCRRCGALVILRVLLRLRALASARSPAPRSVRILWGSS